MFKNPSACILAIDTRTIEDYERASDYSIKVNEMPGNSSSIMRKFIKCIYLSFYKTEYFTSTALQTASTARPSSARRSRSSALSYVSRTKSPNLNVPSRRRCARRTYISISVLVRIPTKRESNLIPLAFNSKPLDKPTACHERISETTSAQYAR